MAKKESQPESTGHTCDSNGRVLVTAYNPKPNITKTETSYTCSKCGLVTRTTSNTTADDPD